MKLSTNADGTFTLMDDVGDSIHVEDELELCEAYIQFEKVLGAPDEGTRYRLLEGKIDVLLEMVKELKKMSEPNDSTIQILELIGELHYRVTAGQGKIIVHTPEGDQTFFVNQEQGEESTRHILHWLQSQKAAQV